MLGEATYLLLREDELAVEQDVELALLTLLDLGLVLGLGVQLGRETRSPRVVAVSDGAVLDEDARHEKQTYRERLALRRRSRALPGGRLTSERGTPSSPDQPRAPETLEPRHRP